LYEYKKNKERACVVFCLFFFFPFCFSLLLDGDEAGSSGTNTGAAVEDGAVGESEFGEVVTDHFTLNFDVLEGVTVVDGNDGSDHLGHDDHITEVGADGRGLLTDLGELLGLAELLHEGHRLALKTAVEASAGTRVEELGELIRLLGDEFVEFHTTEGEFVEGTFLLELFVAFLVDLGSHVLVVFEVSLFFSFFVMCRRKKMCVFGTQ